jgi:hypothetical protein
MGTNGPGDLNRAILAVACCGFSLTLATLIYGIFLTKPPERHAKAPATPTPLWPVTASQSPDGTASPGRTRMRTERVGTRPEEVSERRHPAPSPAARPARPGARTATPGPGSTPSPAASSSSPTSRPSATSAPEPHETAGQEEAGGGNPGFPDIKRLDHDDERS